MADTAQDILKGLGFETGETAYPVTQTVSESTLVNAKREAEKDKPGFLASLPVAASEEWIIPTLANNVDRFRSYEGQPVDKFTPELLTTLTDGLTDYTAIGEVLDEALTVGVDSALATKETHLTTQANRAELAEAGWKGTTSTFLASMFDPVEWSTIIGSTAAVSALSGPAAPLTGTATLTAGAALKAKKAYSKARAFAAGATVTGAELAAFESIRAGLKYDIDGNDVLIAMGFGAGLGGTLNTATTAFVKRGNVAQLAKIVADGGELTPAQKAFYEANNVEAVAQRLIDENLKTEQFIESLDATDLNKSLGEEVQVVTPAAKVTDEEAAAIPEIAGWSMLGLRKLISTGYRAGMSEVNRIRLGARKLGMNGVGYKDGKLEANDSASEIAERTQGQFRTSFAYMLHPNQRKWTKRTGGSISDFNTLAARYARGLISDVDPEVKAIGDLVKKQERALAEMGIKYDVAGFTPNMLDRHLNYLPRIFNEEKIRDLRAKLGDSADEQIANLIEAALRKGQPDIVNDVIKKLVKKAEEVSKKKPTRRSTKDLEAEANEFIRRIATGYTKGIVDRTFKKSGGPAGANEMTLEDIADLMKAEFKDELSPDAIDDVLELLVLSKPAKGHKRSRPRLILDESTSISVTRADGEMEDLRFYDLLEEDIEQLHNSYIFQMSGAIGLARNGINTNQVGSSFEEFIDSIRTEVKTRNLSSDKAESEINSLKFMYDGITGRLAHREEISNRARDFNIGVRAYSFSVNMGMSGMSAMMELSNAMFEYSLTTLMRTMPAYNQLFKKASQGQLEDGLMKELIEAFGIGGEVQLGRYNRATRYEGSNVEGYIGPEQHWAGKAALKGQQFVSYWSGLNGITQTLRRMSMLHYTTQWAKAAKKGGMPFSDIKLKQLGISDEMGVEIKKAINKHATFKGTVVDRLNLEKWDENVREAFQASGFKEARQNVQEMNIASTNGFLRSEIGKTFFQFLSFPLASLEQQTMRLGVRAAHGDVAVAKIIMSAAFMGSMMYLARVQMNAMGRSDADEYIKERMSPTNFAVGAMSQIGAASMFSYIYQLTTGAMDGNTYAMTPPAISIAQSGFQLLKAFENGEISESEYRRALRLLPGQSLYGARQLINNVANELGN